MSDSEEIMYIDHGDKEKKAHAGQKHIAQDENQEIFLHPSEIKPEKPEPKADTADKETEAQMPAEEEAEAQMPAEEEAEAQAQAEEEPAEAEEDTAPKDKIEEITSNEKVLPLPSKETDDIEPLLPY